MVRHIIAIMFSSLLMISQSTAEQVINPATKQIEAAIHLTPNIDRGREVYRLCAVCHMPEAWGTVDGYYPQIAGQHATVIIKQLADIEARNRDNPTMLPFALLENLQLQDFADVAAYLADLPMMTDNGLGPGTDLVHGKRLYDENCVECHGRDGEGIAKDFMPLLQGQHYNYLVRQFEWIRDGKRRNADAEMVEQIQRFTDRDISAIMDYTSRLPPPIEQLAEPGWQNPDFTDFVRTDSQE